MFESFRLTILSILFRFYITFFSWFPSFKKIKHMRYYYCGCNPSISCSNIQTVMMTTVWHYKKNIRLIIYLLWLSSFLHQQCHHHSNTSSQHCISALSPTVLDGLTRQNKYTQGIWSFCSSHMKYHWQIFVIAYQPICVRCMFGFHQSYLHPFILSFHLCTLTIIRFTFQ